MSSESLQSSPASSSEVQEYWPDARVNDTIGHALALMVALPIAIGVTAMLMGHVGKVVVFQYTNTTPTVAWLWLVVTGVAWAAVVALARATPRGRVVAGVLFGVAPMVLLMLNFRWVARILGSFPSDLMNLVLGLQMALYPVAVVVAAVFIPWGLLDRERRGV